MSDAYQVFFDERTAGVLADLPPDVREEAAAALLDAAREPWACPRWSAQYPPEYRLVLFGNGFGWTVFAIRDADRRLLVFDVGWAG